MNTQSFLMKAGVIPFLAALALAVAGCSTTPKVDWNARVGVFTYDQAVAELGPPDRQAALSDGKTVAEWVTGHSSGGGLSIGTGFYGSHAGVGVGKTFGSGSRDRILRLNFSKDGRLESWAQN
jgi:hypothetical protein